MGGKIVFVNQAAGYLTIDIVNVFALVFDKTALIYGDLRIQDVELDPRVIKSKIKEKTRKSNTARFFRWTIATIQIYFLLITKYRKYEIFYFSVPPFAYLCSLFLRRRFSILMWDVFPDTLKIFNINETSFIYRLWAKTNKLIFKRAYRIYTIGEEQRKLLSCYAIAKEINVINLWSGIRVSEMISKNTNQFVLQNYLLGKFIVQYSGNIGPTYNIETLIDVAYHTRDHKDIIYLIIGRGIKYFKAQKIVEKRGLNNFLFLPFQPDNILRLSLAAADVGVVLIDKKVSSASIPSKIYNLFAVGIPILNISPPDNELSKLITLYNTGGNFSEDEIEKIADFIIYLKDHPDKKAEYQKNSFAASKNYTYRNANLFLNDYFS